jgi:hypothetical protein
MKTKNSVKDNFIYESRDDARSTDISQQLKILIELKMRNNRIKDVILPTRDVGFNSLFLLIPILHHSYKINDIIELRCVIDNEPVVKGGIVRRICDDGLGIETCPIEEIEMKSIY